MSRRRGAAAMAGMVLAAAGAVIGGAAAGEAHAQDGDGATLPAWIKTLFGYYAAGDIGDGEIIAALEYLINGGVISVSTGAASEPAAGAGGTMSEEAKSLAMQADIAECLGDENRVMIAAWELDVRATRDYTTVEYEAEMQDLITAGRASVQATDAWAAVARQAAADGTITAAERTKITAADDDMAAADADVYEAFMATAAGQMMDAMGGMMDGMIEGYLQMDAISGDATECY